jgi:hypothetical protein
MSLFARVSVRALRKVAACALPRPSAGFREIRKKQGNPEPKADLKREFQRGRVYPCHKLTQVDNRRQHADDFDHEHDRIADHESRIELAKRVPDRRTDDRRIEQGAHVSARIISGFH